MSLKFGKVWLVMYSKTLLATSLLNVSYLTITMLETYNLAIKSIGQAIAIYILLLALHLKNKE